jgi:hypothetical protein
MLAGVNQTDFEILTPGLQFPKGVHDGRDFHEIWPSARYQEEFHRSNPLCY